MDLREIASVSGKGGLFKVVKPTRTGVILESMDDTKKKIIATSGQKISVLKEISIYIDGADENLPLEEVLFRINDKHGVALTVSGKSSDAELKTFFESIVPEYDRERVYASDMRKIINWYSVLTAHYPDLVLRPKEEVKESKKKEKPAAESKPQGEIEEKTAEEKPKKAPAKKKAETAQEDTTAPKAKKTAPKAKKSE